MSDFISWLAGSDKFAAGVAGAAGGVVKWLTLKESTRDGITSIVVGAICAVYLNPLALPIIEPVLGKVMVDEAARISFSGFVIGLGGVVAAGLVIDMWRSRKGAAK